MTMEDAVIASDLMLDGNALAGMLAELFGTDVTVVPAKCAACGEVNPMGALHAYVRAPGSVLRCPGCKAAMIRVVVTGAATTVELRGVAFLRFERART